MVDEFQDISEPRARLVKALRDSHKGSSLFAVGDDWQAIYRFSGADLRLTTQFEQYFGFTSQSELDLTFRFNNKIGQVATRFISKNPNQLTKNIKSLSQVNAPAISIIRRAATSANKNTLKEVANGALFDVLEAIQNQARAYKIGSHKKPDKNNSTVTVLLLARNWFQLPSSAAIAIISANYPLVNITAQTFHASKGKEADYVIIIGLQNGKHGFPAEKNTPAIVDALLPPMESFPHAEERRLFYVALTRAKHKVYIIVDMANTSRFIPELINEHDIELDEFSDLKDRKQ